MVNRRRRRPGKIVRRILLLLAGALVLVGVLGRLALASPWARMWVARKIEARVGLPASVEGLSWWPWSGVQVSGIRVEQPQALSEMLSEPLVAVEEIRIWPDYRRSLRGRPVATSLEITGPKGVVSLEMLASLVAGMLEQVPPAPAGPPLAVVPDSPQVTQGERAGVGEPARGSDTEKERPVVRHDEEAETGKPVTEKEVPAVCWVMIREADLRLVWGARHLDLAALKELEVSLPFGGVADWGSFQVGKLEILGETLLEGVPGQVAGGAGGVKLSIPEISGNSTKLALDTVLLRNPGSPFQVQLGFEHRGGLGAGDEGVKVGGFVVQGSAAGWLQVPASWQANGRVQATELAWQVSGQSLQFDHGAAQMKLAGGRLEVPDARLLGTGLALLGNGRLDSDEGSSVVRVVVPPASVAPVSDMVARRTKGARIRFQAFDPPDRWYADVNVWRTPEGWRAQLGRGGSEVPIGLLWEGLQRN